MSVTLPKISMTLCMALKIQIPFRFANYVWMAQQHTASDRVVTLMVQVQVVFLAGLMQAIIFAFLPSG